MVPTGMGGRVVGLAVIGSFLLLFRWQISFLIKEMLKENINIVVTPSKGNPRAVSI
jgi:hypothetical protein